MVLAEYGENYVIHKILHESLFTNRKCSFSKNSYSRKKLRIIIFYIKIRKDRDFLEDYFRTLDLYSTT